MPSGTKLSAAWYCRLYRRARDLPTGARSAGVVRALALVAVVCLGALSPVVAAGQATQGTPRPGSLVDQATQNATITIDHQGENLTVANSSQQVVTGTADLPKGTELTVRARSTGDTEPRFFKTRTAVVRADGTWGVTFDFSGQRAGGTFSLTVATEDGNHSVSLNGVFEACGSDCSDPTPRPTPTPIPEQRNTPTADDDGTTVTFQKHVVSVTQGEVAALPIKFDGTDRAVVVLGNESEVNYELVVSVVDGDGDGQAVLYVDTAKAGQAGQTVSVSGGDQVRVRHETDLGSRLDSGSYDVSLYAGDEATGKPNTLGSLVVQAADTDTPGGGNAPETGTGTPTDPQASDWASQDLLGFLASGLFLLGGGALAFVLLGD